MAKILAYQLNLRDHHSKRIYSPKEESLTANEVARASSLGDLDPSCGILVIKPKLIKIFKDHECWEDFNST